MHTIKYHLKSLTSDVFSLHALKSHRIQWDDAQKKTGQGPIIDWDGIPFIHLGSRTYECHQGPHHPKKSKSKVCIGIKGGWMGLIMNIGSYILLTNQLESKF